MISDCMVTVNGALQLVSIAERKSKTAFTRYFILNNSKTYYVEKYGKNFYVYAQGDFSNKVLINAASYRKAFLTFIM